jgi:hypothetical protein
MENYWINLILLSDATFGRGEGVAGVVDQEVDYDGDGVPYLHGKTLKGLLNEECANLLYALHLQSSDVARWEAAAQRLLGSPGSRLAADAHMRVGPARLPADLRRALHQEILARRLTSADVLATLTTIRRQTAVDETTGAPDTGTLRALRVILRQTHFTAPVTFPYGAHPDDVTLLSACVLALRRAGIGRNRGRGRLCATLHADAHGAPGEDITRAQLAHFAHIITAHASEVAQ